MADSYSTKCPAAACGMTVRVRAGGTIQPHGKGKGRERRQCEKSGTKAGAR